MTCSTERASRLAVRVLLAASVLLCVSSLSPARAEAPETANLYEQGKAALDAGDHTTALQRFKAVLNHADTDEGRAWQMMLAIAVTYRDMEEMGYAIDYYKRFLSRSEEFRATLDTKWLKRRALVEADIPNLEAEAARTHAIVLITSKPPGAQVFINKLRAGADADGVTPQRAYLKPGKHRIRVKLDGHLPAKAVITAVAGKLQPLTLKLEPVPAAPAPQPKVTPVGPPSADATVAMAHEPDEGGDSIGGWLLVGGSAVALVGAAVVTVVAGGASGELDALKNPHPDWTPAQYLEGSAEWRSLESERDTMRVVSGVLYGVAAASLVGGLIWVAAGGGDESAAAPPSRAPAVVLTPTPSGVFGHATWRF
jgi:hypothetical protein